MDEMGLFFVCPSVDFEELRCGVDGKSALLEVQHKLQHSPDGPVVTYQEIVEGYSEMWPGYSK